MRRKTLIAIAVAGLLAAPLALAQYGSSGSTGSGTSTPNVYGKSNEDRSAPPGGTAGGDTSASTDSGMSSGRATISAREFRRLDKNQDGSLSKDEASGDSKLSSDFDQLDADHDGKLTMAEATGSSGSGRGERISRNDRGTGSDAESPSIPRDPQTPGNPPRPGTGPE
jgi:EF hand domain-containing protein